MGLSPNIYTCSNFPTKNNFSLIRVFSSFFFFFLKQPRASCRVAQVIAQHLPLILLTVTLHAPWLIRAGAKGLYDTQERDRHGSSSMSHEDGLYLSLSRYWETSMWFMFLASYSPPVHLYAFLQRKKVNVPLKCPGNVLLISTISEEPVLYLRCCSMKAT